MAIKFKVGKVKARGLGQFAVKELNNPKFLEAIGLNRIKVSKETLKKFPTYQLFLLNTNQLKDEYNRLREPYNQGDIFKQQILGRRLNHIANLLRARGVKVRNFPTLTSEGLGEVGKVMI